MKKLVIVLVFICMINLASANIYYIKNNGDDSAEGLSDATAWQTLYKASITAQVGDTILLRRGDTWYVTHNKRDSLAIGMGLYIQVDNLIVGAYGTGNKPIIDATSQSYNGDLRGTAAYSPIEVGVRYGHESSGVIIQDLDLRGPHSGSVIAAYNTGSDLTISRCDIIGSGWAAEALIVAGSGDNNIRIEDCSFDALSGSESYSKSIEIRGGSGHIIRSNTFRGYTTGGAIRFSDHGTGALIEKNFIYGPDTREDSAWAIVIRSGDGGKYIVRNNVIDLTGTTFSNNALTGMRFWYDYQSTERVIHNNVIIGDGRGSAFNGHGSTTTLYNNIIYGTYRTYDGSDMAATFTNNLLWNVVRSLTPDLIESGTVYGNPNLVDSTMSNHIAADAKIQYPSAAIDAGSSSYPDIPTDDYEGVSRPQGSGIDIGAFEYLSEEPPTCIDSDGDGYNITGSSCGIIDCNDNNISINPSAIEVCDSVDNNCDGSIDEGCEEPPTYHEADDNPQDGCIKINELISYIGEWKVGDVDITDLIEAIGLWKVGC